MYKVEYYAGERQHMNALETCSSRHIPLFDKPSTNEVFTKNFAHEPPQNEEIYARIALLKLPHVGNYTAHQWVLRYGSAREVLKMIHEESLYLSSWKTNNSTVHKRLRQAYAEAESILCWCLEHEIQLIPTESALFPASLSQLPSCPLTLFAKGNLDLLRDKNTRLAFFGKKKSTPYGIRAIHSIIEEISGSNLGVVSSLGTDSGIQAAYSAIRHGQAPIVASPVAFHQLLKGHHRKVSQYILDHGGLILSDQIPGDSTKSYYYMLTQVRLLMANSKALMLAESDPQYGTSFAVLVSRQLRLPIFVTHPTDKYAAVNPELIRLIRSDKTVIPIESRHEICRISHFFQSHEDMFASHSNLIPLKPDMHRVFAWS